MYALAATGHADHLRLRRLPLLRLLPHRAHAALREPAALLRWVVLRWPFRAAAAFFLPLV